MVFGHCGRRPQHQKQPQLGKMCIALEWPQMRPHRDQDSIGQGDQTRKLASAAYQGPFKRHELNENKSPMTLRHLDDTEASNMPVCQPLCSCFVHAVCWALDASPVRLSLSGSHPTRASRLGDLERMA